MMDISDTLAPNSDQLDAIELVSGPRTFTIERVGRNTEEQPLNIYLSGFPRPWRPGKSMRRVLVAIWGKDASVYVGRRLTLWCDPTIRFGPDVVGGTRISHMSHLDKPKSVPLLVGRGKTAPYRVLPLAEEAPAAPAASLALRIDEAVKAFANGGVTQDQLQARVGAKVEEWTDQNLADLLVVFQQLKNRTITKEQAFPTSPAAPNDAPAGDRPPSDADIEAANGHWAEQ